MSVGRFDLAGYARKPTARLAATVMVATPLVIAIVAGFLAFGQLRDALTFDQRTMRAVWLHTHIMRLQVDEETGVRGFAATHNPALLGPYTAAGTLIDTELTNLAAITSDLRIANGPTEAHALAGMHAHWVATVAVPLIAGGTTPAQTDRIVIRGESLIDAFRAVDGRLGKTIRGVVTQHRDAFNIEFLRIAVLFLSSIVMCVLGITLAAAALMRVDRARARAEAALREREILYEQGRVWSKSFQRAVLPPRLPAVTGCRFDAVYEPGESDARVGGDWYDAVRLIDGRILISIGDVAGSGLEAAVVMGVVRQIMRGIAQLHANPALMLDAADRALRVEYSDVFVTAWVGIVDMVTRTLSYASAGHPPVLLADRAGDVRDLRDSALPLGLRQGHQENATTIALTDGATLVLYTDGLTEATRDILAGDALVREAAARVGVAPWQHPASEVQHHVLAGRAMDDVAILVARLDFAEVEQYITRWSFDVRDARAAHHARDRFRAALAQRNFAAIESLNAELVFGELIGNVLRHAEQSADVEIAIDCSAAQLVLHVFDRGPGFRHISRLPSDPYAESGRGLFLIAAMTEDFTVIERPGGGSHARAVLLGLFPHSLIAQNVRVPQPF